MTSILANPFLTSATWPAGAIVAETATVTEETSVPVTVAELIPVSDGGPLSSLPSGEMESVVTLVCPPSESRFILNEQAFMEALEEPPLFLRKLLEIEERA